MALRSTSLVFLVFLVLSACGSPSPDVTCGAPAPCPFAAGRSYRSCTSADGSTCSFHAGDGTVFACAGCADCAGAATQVAGWCSGSSASSDGGTSGSDGGVTIPPGGGASPDATCATLLDCLAHNVPGAFAAALQTYGNGSVCWQNASTAQTCHQACQASVAQYERGGQCCLADGDCKSATPHCDLATHACVACPFDCCSQDGCQGRGTCDPTHHTCGCSTDGDCTSSAAPYCDPQSRTCEACPFACCSQNQCAGGNDHVCDPASHACVGCLANSDCGIPFLSPEVCNPATHQCLGCLSDHDCAGQLLFANRTHCDATNSCVECLNDGQCTTGHCAGGTCVCTDDTQCAATPATPRCGANTFGVKVCGQCADNTQCTTGLHCLDQTCTKKECFTSSDCGGGVWYCDSSGQCQLT